MNILIFSWRGPKHPNSGGAEIVTHQHATAWVNAGHQVTWFTSAWPGVPDREVIDGIQIIRRGQQLVTIQLAAIYWYLFKPHPNYDLVVDQFHGLPFFTPLYIKTKRLAFIHEVAKEVWWTNHLRFPINYLFGLIGYLAEPLIFWLYKNTPFLTVSPSTKSDLVTWGIPQKNITVVYNGVSTLPVEVPKEPSPTVIFLGAVARDKGIEDALAVFAQLIAHHRSWQFWVAGRGEDRYLDHLKQLAKKYQIATRLRWWGFVTDREKFELLAKAHVMVNPSHREGWGLVNIEANSVGTPVVAYDVPGCRDSVLAGQTGRLCPKSDISCLVRAINDLVTNQSEYHQLADRARAWARQFTWAKSHQASLKLIQKLASPEAV